MRTENPRPRGYDPSAAGCVETRASTQGVGEGIKQKKKNKDINIVPTN